MTCRHFRQTCARRCHFRSVNVPKMLYGIQSIKLKYVTYERKVYHGRRLMRWSGASMDLRKFPASARVSSWSPVGDERLGFADRNNKSQREQMERATSGYCRRCGWDFRPTWYSGTHRQVQAWVQGKVNMHYRKEKMQTHG